MKKRCSKCQAILLENVTQCPLCYETTNENEAQYTLDDIQTLYVKRKNDKIFGPFPKSKVSALVSTGKLEAGEFISDDREKWIPVSGVQEFSALLKAVPTETDSSLLHDLPGLKTSGPSVPADLPDFKLQTSIPVSELPGLKSSVPEKKIDFPVRSELAPSMSGAAPGGPLNLPGLKTNLPLSKAEQPGAVVDLPGIRQDLPGVRADLPGVRADLPGVRADLPGVRADLPGVRPDLPGSRTDLPGVRTDLPGPRPDLPGVRTDLPGPRPDLPGVRTDLPGSRTDLPGSRTDLPGSRTDLPGSRPDLPGSRTDLPGSRTDLPGSRPDLPGVRPDLPSTSPGEEEDRGKNREFSLPPLGGGLIPEMKLDLTPTGSRPLEISDVHEGRDASKKLQMPPSLFESSDGVDLSVLDQKNSPAKTQSGLDLDPDHHQAGQAVPASMGMSDETTLALSMEDDLQPGKSPVRPKPESKPSMDKRVWLLLPLVLLLVVAAAFQFKLGPFAKEKGTSTNHAKLPQSTRPTAAVISEHEKNVLNLDFGKLMESARGEAMIHCESALILAWFYHEYERLDSCRAFLQTPIASTGDPETRRFQFFRALYLNQKPRQAQQERFYTGPPVADPIRIMEDILSISRSENNRAPVWNFLGGVLLLEKKDAKKAHEAFQMVNSTETTPTFGVTWFLSQLGDEAAIKVLNETTQWAFWKNIFPGFQYQEKMLQSFTFLAFPGEFPRIAVPEPVVLEKVGRRFKAINYTFSAIAAWEGGQLDTANSLCDKALSEDEQERIVWNLCSRLRLFHGQLGKFSTTISMNQEVPTILAWIIEGRRNPALTAWEEVKKQDPAGSLAVTPLILLLSLSESADVEAAIQAGMTADIQRTLEYLWTGIWQRPDLAEIVEKGVLAWKNEKKDDSVLVADFLRILTLVQALHAQDWKKVIDTAENWKLKGSLMLEIEALVMMARMNASKDNAAVIWADSQIQRVSPGARSAAALMNILGSAGKVQEAHQILDKYQEVFKEPMFFKAAAQLYLQGTRKDRLMRARFFADLALKGNNQDVEALFLVGFIQLESGQAESGEKTIVQGVQSMSRPIPSWFMRWSELESRLKRPHMALAAMDAGLRKIPDHGPFLFRKAQILATQDNPKEALSLLEKTKESGIEEVQRFILEGRCHVSLRQKREAEISFSKAVKADNKNILARYLLGKTLLSNGSLRPAIPHLQFVAEELEKAAQEQRIPEEATHWQNETLESMLSETCRLLGGAYKETGNRTLAIKYVKKYATLVPDGPMKDEALRLLLLLGGE